MLFCDLVDSTALAERLDPEDWRDAVVRFQQAVIPVIEDAGGHIAQHLGDGLLVYFGYPRAREDDVERALNCGLALIRATRRLNPELQAAHGLELQLRVGIHAGPVVVGEVGGVRRETLALGSAANVAARVQGAAAPDTVVVSESTLKRVAPLFDTEDLGERALKGIARAVRLHRVRRPSGTRDRFGGNNRPLTPLVGRERELETLQSKLALADQGDASAIAVRGEAGIGKSRLLHALRQLVGQRPLLWCECRAVPFSQDTPLYPWIQLQHELIELGSARSDLEKLQRLEGSVTSLGMDPAETVPVLASLHGVPVSERYSVPTLSALGMRKRTLSVMTMWLLHLALGRTVVLVVEDLHWLDPSSAELTAMLLTQARGTRLLPLLTTRPEYEPEWLAGAERLSLERLSGEPLRTLIDRAAESSPLPRKLAQTVFERSDGVPLFAEELVRALAEDADFETDSSHPPPSSIPDTLEDLLMARLEQADDVREVAQLASVLGREFPKPLLEALWPGGPAALNAGLRSAEQRGILTRSESDDGTHYCFCHALIRDAAYSTLLRKTRRAHHAAVARTLRERFPDTTQARPELLAHHLTEAHEHDLAIAAWLEAGAYAMKRAAYEEAILHLRRARPLLAELPNDERALDIEQMLGGALVMARGWAHDETRAAWEAAARLSDPVGDPLRAGAIACGLGDVYSSVDLEKSLTQFEALIEEGRSKNLPLLTIAGHQGAAIPLRYMGRFADARRHLDRGLAIYDPEQHRFGESGFHEEKGISLLCWSAWVHWDVGALREARSDAARALELAERLSNPFAVAFAASWGAIVEVWSCNWRGAIDLGARAARLAAEQGFSLLEAMGRFAELPGRGIAEGMVEAPLLFQLEIERLAKTGNRLGGAEVLGVLANLLLEQGHPAPAFATAEAGLGLSASMQQPWCDAWLWTIQARALLAQEQHAVHSETLATARDLLNRSLDLAQRQGARFYALRAATSLAELASDQARTSDCRRILSEALAGFDENTTSVEIARARALMSQTA